MKGKNLTLTKSIHLGRRPGWEGRYESRDGILDGYYFVVAKSRWA